MAVHAHAGGGQLTDRDDENSCSNDEVADPDTGAAESISTDEDMAVSREHAAPPDSDSSDVDTPGDGRLREDFADSGEDPRPARKRLSGKRLAFVSSVAIVVALGGLIGWLEVRAHHMHAAQDRRALYLQVGRQAATNLSTIDWQQADRDVQRILDGATGVFRDDFTTRSKPFVDLVKQSHSTTVGTVTEAALESESGSTAQVIVAVTVRTSNAAAPQQDPRSWRMRISVELLGGQPKVSNVQFVP